MDCPKGVDRRVRPKRCIVRRELAFLWKGRRTADDRTPLKRNFAGRVLLPTGIRHENMIGVSGERQRVFFVIPFNQLGLDGTAVAVTLINHRRQYLKQPTPLLICD